MHIQNCCSARLSWAQVPAFVGSSVWDRKKKRGGDKGGGGITYLCIVSDIPFMTQDKCAIRNAFRTNIKINIFIIF